MDSAPYLGDKRGFRGQEGWGAPAGTWRRKQKPQEGSLWAELYPACPIRPSLGGPQCPWKPPVSVCLSIRDRSRAGQAGWLLWWVGVCVCVVPWMATRKILHYIQTNTLGFVTLLLNTAKHSSNRTRRSRGAASPGGAEAPALGKESLKPTMEEGDGRGYTSQFPFTRPPRGSTEAMCQDRPRPSCPEPTRPGSAVIVPARR